MRINLLIVQYPSANVFSFFFPSLFCPFRDQKLQTVVRSDRSTGVEGSPKLGSWGGGKSEWQTGDNNLPNGGRRNER